MQENTKSVAVKMTARRCFRTEPIWQYDGGHVLTFEGFELPAAFEVHFSRSPMGKAIPQIGTDGVCTVPEMFTQDAGVIYAWLYIADTDSRLTKYSIEIPVTKRAKPTNQEPTPVEQSAIDQAIAALNAGVERSETAADAAESAQEAAEEYAEAAGNSAITATNAASSAASAKTAAETAARNAATSATDAHTSREAADQSATNAGVSERAAASSASAAAGSATSAAASAGQASASATAASGSASTASTKASEAAQSATAAAGSAASASEDAGTASTAATAAGASADAAAGSATAAAGSATSAGQSATAAAGSAAQAQDVLDSIPADYSEMTADVSNLKSAINELEPVVDDLKINKADIIISSASGAIASFSDGGDGMPVKELTVGIEPMQDLHGYDHPWPAGGGKNLLNTTPAAVKPLNTVGTWNGNAYTKNGVTFAVADDGTITVSGTASTTVFFELGNFTTGDTVCKFNGFQSSATFSLVAIIDSTLYGSTSGDGRELPANSVARVVIYVSTGTATGNTVIKPMIRLSSETDATFAPYENLCPISGFDSVKVTRTGTNLVSVDEIAKTASGTYYGISTQKTANGYTFNGVSSASGWKFFGGFPIYSNRTFEVLANKTYVISYMQTGGFHLQGNILDKNNKQITASNNAWITPASKTDATTGRNYAVFVPSANGRIAFIVNVSLTQGTEYNGSISDIQLELASAPTGYKPYSGQTIQVEFPSEAGTVYGGSLTVNEDGTGQVVVDRGEYTFTGDEAWHASSTAHRFYVNAFNTYLPNPIAILKIGTDDEQNAITSVFGKCIYKNADGVAYFAFPSNTPQFVVNEPSAETVDDIKAIVAGTQLVYELATPLTYTLTASQVQTILGTNNVWADAGDVSVSYRADTKLYIDNKITQAIAAALNA